MSKDIMLTEQQASFYKKNGYLIVDNVFNGNEIDTLLEALNELSICASSPNYVFEEDGVIRSIFAPHKLHPEFDALYKDKRLTLPARQILENDIYLYQFKLNNKKALVGKSWEWHQDFPYWKIDDGVKEPNMISVMIL